MRAWSGKGGGTGEEERRQGEGGRVKEAEGEKSSEDNEYRGGEKGKVGKGGNRKIREGKERGGGGRKGEEAEESEESKVEGRNGTV